MFTHPLPAEISSPMGRERATFQNHCLTIHGPGVLCSPGTLKRGNTTHAAEETPKKPRYYAATAEPPASEPASSHSMESFAAQFATFKSEQEQQFKKQGQEFKQQLKKQGQQFQGQLEQQGQELSGATKELSKQGQELTELVSLLPNSHTHTHTHTHTRTHTHTHTRVRHAHTFMFVCMHSYTHRTSDSCLMQEFHDHTNSTNFEK